MDGDPAVFRRQTRTGKLTPIDAVGYYCDGANLYLVVKRGSAAWAFRYVSPVTGKRHEMGLGAANRRTLANARSKAQECRLLLADGLDPMIERVRARRQAKRPSSPARKRISLAFRYKVLERHRFRCFYCGRRAGDVELELDHADSLANGGADVLDNFRPACTDCNQGKGRSSAPPEQPVAAAS